MAKSSSSGRDRDRTDPEGADDGAAASAPVGDDVAAAAENPSELGIDVILGRLERVVKELEGGDLPLERALERFELGVRLARRGSQVLDGIEERVEMLLAERDEVVPLPRPAGRSDHESRGEPDDDGG